MKSFKKEKDRIIFVDEDSVYSYSFKDKSYYVNDKIVSFTAFKNKTKGLKFTEFSPIDENSTIYLDILYNSSLEFSNRVKSISTVLNRLENNCYVEQYLLFVKYYRSKLKYGVSPIFLSEVSVKTMNILGEYVDFLYWLNKTYKLYDLHLDIDMYKRIAEFIQKYKQRENLPNLKIVVSTMLNNYISLGYTIEKALRFVFNFTFPKELFNLLYVYNISPKELIKYIDYLHKVEGISYDYKKDIYNTYATIGLYYDYIEMRNTLYEETGVKYKQFPTNFLSQKQILTNELNIFKKLKQEKEYRLPYEYKDSLPNKVNIKEYVLIKPMTYLELLDEGTQMNHCVGSYWNKITNGNSIIYCLREAEDISTSVCTVEIVNNNGNYILNQVRLRFNHKVNEDNVLYEIIKQFCNKYKVEFNTLAF